MDEFPGFPFNSWRVYLAGQVVTGGQSTSGQVQTAKTDGGGRWVVEAADAQLFERGQLNLWRKFEALLDGGGTEVVVPLCDIRQAPVPVIDGKPYFGSRDLPHSDGALFSDGAGYAQLPVYAETGGSAPLRATTIPLHMIQAGDVIGGEHFSLDHATAGRRMYRIARVVSDDDAGNLVVQIRPPLREAITAGMVADFNKPGCVMRQATAEAAPAVEGHILASASISFIESFDYAS